MGKLGIANSWTIVLLSCLLLALWIFRQLLDVRRSLAISDNAANLICLLTLLSLLMVQNVTYPLSDICYFGASAISVPWSARRFSTPLHAIQRSHFSETGHTAERDERHQVPDERVGRDDGEPTRFQIA